MNNPYKYNYLNNDVKDNFSGCKLPLVNIRQGSIHYIDNVIRIAVINTNFAIGYRNDGNSYILYDLDKDEFEKNIDSIKLLLEIYLIK